jgi:hypothetical protein
LFESDEVIKAINKVMMDKIPNPDSSVALDVVKCQLPSLSCHQVASYGKTLL